MNKITKKIIKNRKFKISTQNEQYYTGSTPGTYTPICKVIWPVILENLNFWPFSAHLHIFGNDNFIWTKSHLQSIMHLHTKFQEKMCSGSQVFAVDGHTSIHPSIQTYILQTPYAQLYYKLTLVYQMWANKNH